MGGGVIVEALRICARCTFYNTGHFVPRAVWFCTILVIKHGHNIFRHVTAFVLALSNGCVLYSYRI